MNDTNWVLLVSQALHLMWNLVTGLLFISTVTEPTEGLV